MMRLTVINSFWMTLSCCAAALFAAGCETEPEQPGAEALEAGAFPPERPPGKADWGQEIKVGAMDGYNHVDSLERDYEKRYAMLPSSGKTSKTPWTDSYWPKQDGGIGFRWQVNEKHTYESPTREELLQMSPEEIANLSPAEKYDIYVGNYEYPLTIREKASNKPTEASWTGHCHGWTPAAIRYEEPAPVMLTNADGIQIAFGSSDVKALLTYFEGEVVQTRMSLPFRAETRTVGTLCKSAHPRDPGCYDSNPGAFHIVMANQIGLRDEAFGIDADISAQKWNQPVHTYESHQIIRRAPSAGASDEAVEEVVVQSLVTYTMEIHPTWDAVLGTERHSDTTKTYTYTLELNAAGEIVGGQWVVLLEGLQTLTLHELYEDMLTRDDNGDGSPDYSDEQARATVWSYFDFPDYVWKQDKIDFPESFSQPMNSYELVVNTNTSRRSLYSYFGKLEEIYEASIAERPF